jgi:hypothetical protein
MNSVMKKVPYNKVVLRFSMILQDRTAFLLRLVSFLVVWVDGGCNAGDDEIMTSIYPNHMRTFIRLGRAEALHPLEMGVAWVLLWSRRVMHCIVQMSPLGYE